MQQRAAKRNGGRPRGWPAGTGSLDTGRVAARDHVVAAVRVALTLGTGQVGAGLVDTVLPPEVAGRARRRREGDLPGGGGKDSRQHTDEHEQQEQPDTRRVSHSSLLGSRPSPDQRDDDRGNESDFARVYLSRSRL